ncbi:MAG TPA: 2-C-methyl-D-erythritol 4-phosphate cytidylyltransferase, partial [Magnetococcales bacterium]|nr:2-C-methyl-D-erythritol 4-phosphate cytidylyltransferase [Magnetococcales bacterium]
LALPADAWIGIHDAARPFPGKNLLRRLLDGRRENNALIAALPAADTVKRVDPQSGLILETLDRAKIWLAQTPQLFRYGTILKLHERARAARFEGTDDASLAEWGGLEVRVIPGDVRNIKITHPEDLELAKRWLQEDLS